MTSNFPAKLLEDLETQNLVELEETKKVLFELVSLTKDPWMATGLMDYFYQTGSVRIVDVLLKANHVHIFDRLLEWLRLPTHKLPALALLGHIISRHPTWLYNLEKHLLFRDIFRILKTERDVIPEMSALLCVITLLAKIPYKLKSHLDDLFEVFSYLAAWNNHKTSASSGFKATSADQLSHLQIGLYIYFQRLYGMFPCNFMDYLKREYISPTNATQVKGAIFTHTILPLLETVRMHPKLITETLDTEISEMHWRKVAPHDVITQCSRLSVDSCDNHQSQAYHHDQSNAHHQCGVGSGSGLGYQHHVLEITQTNRYELTTTTTNNNNNNDSKINLSSSAGNLPQTNALESNSYWTPSQMTHLMSPLPTSIQQQQQQQQSAPPSVTLMNSNLNSSGSLVQSSPANIQKHLQKNLQFVSGGLGGTSPPEAAVEATPETTPMNDHLRRSQNSNNNPNNFPPQNSSAVRAIGLSGLISGNSSTPSSPLKKVTAFRYPPEQNTVEHAFSKMIKLQLEATATTAIANTNEQQQQTIAQPTSIPSSPLPILHQQQQLSATAIGGNSNKLERMDHHHPMQKVEPELAKFELSQSPCNVGGLHMPNSRSIQEFKEISMQRERTALRSSVTSESLSPEGNNGNDDNGNRKTMSAQTEPSWNSSAAYDHMLMDLSKEAKRDAEVCDAKKTAAVSPKEILDKIIESAIAKKNAHNQKDLEEYYKNHILLLSYQLNFERQQREMTAERNRRLFGSDKDYKILDLTNKTLQNQVYQLLIEVENLKGQLDHLHSKFAVEKSELVGELTNWKQKFQGDQDELKLLRNTLEQCETRLEVADCQNKERNVELERLRGDLFDYQSEQAELIHQAAMGQHYREQLVNLQSELLLMGELHQQWQNKLCDVERGQHREAEMDVLRMAYEQEVEEYRVTLQQKSSQLDLATAKLKDSDKKLSTVDNLVSEQKRILKITKEEYEERFKALESKYDTQKAIIMKMEEHLLELYKNPATCPPSELLRSEMVSSAEHASPLSISLTSSDGLSTSLRSATEVKAGPTPSSSSGNMIAASISSHTLKATNSTEARSSDGAGASMTTRSQTFDEGTSRK